MQLDDLLSLNSNNNNWIQGTNVAFVVLWFIVGQKCMPNTLYNSKILD